MAGTVLSSWARPDAVVGLGNEIARDDGVGILAARRLEGLLADRGDVEVIALPWAGFALLDALAGRRRVAVVDCLTTGEHPPGTVVRLDVAPEARLPTRCDFRGSVRLTSFHDINFPTVLALGRRMGWQLPAEIAIWAVEAAVVDEFGEGLSPPVAAAALRVVDEVLAFMQPQRTPAVASPTAARPVVAAARRARLRRDAGAAI